MSAPVSRLRVEVIKEKISLEDNNKLKQQAEEGKIENNISDDKNQILNNVEAIDSVKFEGYVEKRIDKIKTEEKEIYNDEEYILSKIIDFATTRPIEVISDFELKTKIEKAYYFEPDSRLIDDKGLRKFCEEHPEVKYLNLGNCDKIMDFSPIGNLKNLEQLDLNNCDYLYDIDFLKTCTKLKVLNIADTDIKYIDVVENMPDLEILNLSTNPVQDIRPLCNCRKLKDLVLWGCLSLENIDALKYCTTLRILDIDSIPVKSLDCLKDLPVLDTLLMDNCGNVSDFSFLKNLTTLKVLACDGITSISTENLKNFSNLTNLVYLTLNNRKISNLEPLKNLINLREIQLKSNLIVDLKPLNNMVNMLKIDLSNNSSLVDLSPLCKMVNLTNFKMEGNTAAVLAANGSKKSITANMTVENFEVVKNFPELKAFYISGNYRVKDLSPLMNCKKLEELSVTSCMQLEDVEFIKYLDQLFLLILNENPRIKDLYCVTNLTKLRQFNYNGTAVPTAKMANVLKRCTSVYQLTGNSGNRIQSQYIVSAKKRCKLYSLRKKIKK